MKKLLLLTLGLWCALAALLWCALNSSAVPPPGGGTSVMPAIAPIVNVIGSRGLRTFAGADGLTNAFAWATNNDYIDIAPGIFELKGYKNTFGTYNGTLQLLNVKNVTINGNGAEVKLTNFGSGLSIVGCSNILIYNLTFSGEMNNVTNYTNASFTLEAAIFTSTNSAGQVSNIKIRDCNFWTLPDQAISFVAGGAHNVEVSGCDFREIGRTNNLPGGYRGDGACVSGVSWSGRISGNTASNVIFFWEWDGIMGPPNKQANGMIVSENWVDRIYSFGVVVNSGANGNSMQGLMVENNFFKFQPGFEAVEAHAGIGLISGAVSNSVFRGNTIVGITNYAVGNGAQVFLVDTYGPFKNLLFTENIFRDCGAQALWLDSANYGAHTVWQGIRFARNIFERCYLPARVFAANISFSENEFIGWTHDIGGNTPGTLWLTGVECSNIVYSANILTPTNVNCRMIGQLQDTRNVVCIDNEYRWGLVMTTPIYTATTASNLFYRGRGSGVPTFGCQAGSLYSRTDTSAVGSLYVQTNSVGLNGWRVNPN
jgi:hypothetical protein